MEKEFGKIRSLIWPIHNYELKKLLPMCLMFFFISFNFTILRDTKDTLIVTAPNSGAETLAFLKVWGVLPCALIFMLIYAKLSNKLNKRALFNVTIIPFIVFFALFATVFYPARDFLHPNVFADNLQNMLPSGFMGFIAIFRNWTFSIFYILAELWGSVVLSLLFWSFANDIMKISEAKRFYALLSLGANIALLVSGPAIIFASNIRKKLPEEVDAWGISLNYLMGMIVISGILIVGIYNWMHKNVLTDPRFYDSSKIKNKKEKLKLSLKDSFLHITKSKYLVLIAAIVVCYNVAINIVEISWKSQLKLQYPNPNDYSTFMGTFSFFMGITAFLIIIFIGGNVVRKFGWGTAARLTPVVLFVTGMIFFSFIFFKDNLRGFISMLGTSPLMFIVIAGAFQNILTKSTKYTQFDPTKEMAYIPLDEESKVKGKAAIDVVGARFGKAGGSLMQQGLIITFGSAIAATSLNSIILFMIILIWIAATFSLQKKFLEKTKEKEAKNIQTENITV
ncbi:MAG: NTP/NDP exchange transporter [Candidatus Thorarchaeota archaeon]